MAKKKKPEIKPVEPSKIEKVEPDIITTPEKIQPALPPDADPIPREPEIEPDKEEQEEND